MKKLLTLFLFLPVAVAAQEKKPVGGMVLDEGEVIAPTPALAMRALLEPRTPNGQQPYEPAIAVLRQRYEMRTAAELDRLVSDLVRVALEGEGRTSLYARLALTSAAMEEGAGVRYPGAVNALIDTYEAAQESDIRNPHLYLLSVYDAGAVEYVVNLLEISPMPPRCMPSGRVEREGLIAEGVDPNNPCPNRSAWCDAAMVLRDTEHAAAPDEEVLNPLCGWGRWIKH